MYMKIFCDYCGQTWDVYPRGDVRGLKQSKQNCCPHCDAAKIDPETWEDVLLALSLTEGVNERLAADHVDKHNALFAVSFIADHLFNQNIE